MEKYEKRLRVVEDSTLISNILFGIAICVLLVTLGISIMESSADWGHLILFLGALRFLLGSSRSLMTRLTAMNRFYPQLLRHQQFIVNCAEYNKDAVPPPPQDFILHAVESSIKGSLQTIDVRAGTHIHLMSAIPLTRYSLAYLCDRLLVDSDVDPRSVLHGSWFVTSRFAPTPEAQFRPISGDEPLASVLQEFDGLGLEDSIRKDLGALLFRDISAREWASTKPEVRALLLFAHARRSGKRYIFVDGRLNDTLSPGAHTGLASYLAGQVLLSVHGLNEKFSPQESSWFAGLGHGGIVGMGSAEWYRSEGGAIAERLSKDADLSSAQVSPSEGLDSTVEDGSEVLEDDLIE